MLLVKLGICLFATFVIQLDRTSHSLREEEVLNVLGMLLLFELELFLFLFGNNNKLFSSLDKGNMESAIHFPSRIQKSRAKEEYQFARHLVRENSLCIHRI